jgi:hypothetical protein
MVFVVRPLSRDQRFDRISAAVSNVLQRAGLFLEAKEEVVS